MPSPTSALRSLEAEEAKLAVSFECEGGRGEPRCAGEEDPGVDVLLERGCERRLNMEVTIGAA